jgi:hypothetical protein
MVWKLKKEILIAFRSLYSCSEYCIWLSSYTDIMILYTVYWAQKFVSF